MKRSPDTIAGERFFFALNGLRPVPLQLLFLQQADLKFLEYRGQTIGILDRAR